MTMAWAVLSSRLSVQQTRICRSSAGQESFFKSQLPMNRIVEPNVADQLVGGCNVPSPCIFRPKIKYAAAHGFTWANFPDDPCFPPFPPSTVAIWLSLSWK